MHLFDHSASWLQDVNITEDGIVRDRHERFGLGAVLIIEHHQSRRLVFVRKSYCPGFEGNDQFAFPGGMVRSTGIVSSLPQTIRASLTARVATEVSFEVQHPEAIAPLESYPPIVAAYYAKGRRHHTVLLPFMLVIERPFVPQSQDGSVYAAQWLEPIQCWADITPTNRLLAAYYLWPRMSTEERAHAKPGIAEAFHQATQWATEVQLPLPALPSPWSESA